MRKPFMAASIAVAALIPAVATAQSGQQSNCERQRSTRVVATVAGAGAGAVLGNVIASHGDKALGTIIGAVGGAVIANQVARPSDDCDHAYGYYDTANRWHATGLNEPDARGYFDRDGGWIDGAPNGHYGADNRWVAETGRTRGQGTFMAHGGWVPATANGYYDRNDLWVAGNANGQPDRRADAYGYYDTLGMWHANVTGQGRATGYYDRENNWVSGAPNGHYDARRNWVPHRDDGSSSGTYDSQNRWIPASSNGYYDSNDQWIAGAASGYYDRRGRWVAGVTTGHYDARGRWIAGSASGHRDASGAWIADPHPGYYDSNRRWHAGTVNGYYDSRGRWIAASDQYRGGDRTGAGTTILSQVSWLDGYVGNAITRGTMSRRNSMGIKRELGAIRSRERAMRHDRAGNLSLHDEATLQMRLDRLTDRLQIAPR